MTGPYTYRVFDGSLVLSEAQHIGLVSEAERQGHKAAAEWIEFDLEAVKFEVLDAHGAAVRGYTVYEQRGATVRERYL